MLRIKLKYFYLFQTIVVVIMVTQLMVIQNSRTYFSSEDINIDQRELKTRTKKVKPLPMCPEKSLLLLGQIFIHRGIKEEGMIGCLILQFDFKNLFIFSVLDFC